MKFRILLKSFDKEYINLACECLRSTLIKTDCSISGTVALPTRIKRFCVLRSPHIDNDSREHFELRLHKRFIEVLTVSPKSLDVLLKTELPSGVSCSLNVLSNS